MILLTGKNNIFSSFEVVLLTKSPTVGSKLCLSMLTTYISISCIDPIGNVYSITFNHTAYSRKNVSLPSDKHIISYDKLMT